MPPREAGVQSLREQVAEALFWEGQASPPDKASPTEIAMYHGSADAAIAAYREHEHDWREEAWQCYVESGADPDGADARHLNPGEAIEAVKELMRDYHECLAAGEGERDKEFKRRLEIEARRFEGDLRGLADA